MRVSVVLEERFGKTPDGRILAPSGVCAYNFWRRYLQVFDSVNVVARVRALDANVKDSTPFLDHRADGPRVSFSCIPHFIGPREYFFKAKEIHKALWQSIARDDAVILRVPGTLGGYLAKHLTKIQRPYAVEVVGDPYDVFAPGAVRHPLRPLFRYLFSKRLRIDCKHAAACSYVTARAIQSRYPSSVSAKSSFYSSIELPPESIAAVPRIYRNDREKAFTVLFVGSLDQMYKAPDVLIDAVARCVESGIDIRLRIIGDGKERTLLQSRPAAAALGNRLEFLGRLPAGKAIRDELDRADLFVLPSRTEGLPRAMIEAMARGLPCIGSTVGGFPELLDEEDLVPPGDAAALAEKIREVMADNSRMERMSQRNLQKSKEYGNDVLQSRRTAFYRSVKELTKAA